MVPHNVTNFGLHFWASLFLWVWILGAETPFSSYPAKGNAVLIEPAQDEKDIRELKPGKLIERELASGGQHSYQVRFADNQFFHLIVNQRSIDVAVTVFGPEGQQVIEVDSPNGREGAEPVLLVVEAAGTYRVEIRSIEKEAPAGRYEIKIEEIRAATQEDRERVADRAAAQQALDQAQLLIVENTASSLRGAIEKFEEALVLARKSGDRTKESFTHLRLGFTYDRLGEKQKGLAHYSLALPILREIGSRKLEGFALNDIGLIYSSLGEQQRALDYYDHALKLKRALGDRWEESITLNNIGLAYVSLGDLQKALDYYAQSLSLARAIGDREGEAVTLVNVGQVYQNLGDTQRALDYYNQSLPITRSVEDWFQEAVTFNSIGVIYNLLGEPQKALDYFFRALPTLRKIGAKEFEAVTLRNIGRAYALSGETDKALDFYNQALELSRALEDRQSEAVSLYSLGEIHYESLRDTQKALDYFNRSLALSRAIEARRYEAPALLGIAKIERGRGNFAVARESIEKALAIVESLRSNVTSQQLRTSFLESKKSYYDFYVDLLMRQHQLHPTEGHDVLALQASEHARARSLVEMLNETGTNIKQGVDPALLERERSLRQQLNARSERQIRLLNSKSDEQQLATLRKEIEDLLSQYRDAEDQIRATSPRYAALAQPVPLSLKEIKQLLDSDTVLLEYSLGEENSYLWVVTETDIRSYVLPRRNELEAAARQVYGLLTARNVRKKFETTEERKIRIAKADAEYAKASAALSQTLLGQVAPRLMRKRLLIVSDGALQYIPFAALPLPSISVTANPNSDNLRRIKSPRLSPSLVAGSFVPLVEEHEIVNLPSVLSLAVLRRESAGRKPAAKTLAVLADPVFEKLDERVQAGGAEQRISKLNTQAAELRNNISPLEIVVRSAGEVDGGDGTVRIQRLPYTRREAEGISSLVPEAELKKALDFAANRAVATGAELSHYRYVHFATHGLLNNSHPELSGLVLSLIDQQGAEQDGFLRAYEIYNLKLPAELIVLSGCRTGLGKEIRGEGIVGLTRGFMYAGAARVLVSLWDVSDKASAELMIQLYKKLLGRERLHPSAALRAAQMQLSRDKRWQAPYYWAAFVLQGEPR